MSGLLMGPRAFESPLKTNIIPLFHCCHTAKVIARLLDSDPDPEKSLGQHLSDTLKSTDQLPARLEKLRDEVEKRRADLAASMKQDISDEEWEQVRPEQLPGPEDIEGPNDVFVCNAGCGRTWDFDVAMNHCRFCNNTGFCDACLAILKNGEMNKHWGKVCSLTCNKTHDWLRLEGWDKTRYIESLLGNVLVGGKIEGGQRFGGEFIAISSWLDELKRAWRYEG